MVTIENLTAKAGRTQILHGITFDVASGDICCVMGKNGSGKSTLLNSISGNPVYRVTADKLELLGVDVTKKEADEKAKLGLFQSFQSPPDFPEITGFDCIDAITTAIGHEPTEKEFANYMNTLMITPEMLARPLNVGFSGGERKRMEILQMLVCKPTVILLDEIDTGLDVDSMILIGKTIQEYVAKTKATVLIVTHYFRFLEYLPPTKVVVLSAGEIAAIGDGTLAEQIDKNGYSSLN